MPPGDWGVCAGLFSNSLAHRRFGQLSTSGVKRHAVCISWLLEPTTHYYDEESRKVQINNSVLGGLQDLSGSTKRHESGLPAASAATHALAKAARADSSGRSSNLADIISQYDLSQITPQGFSEMVQKLHQAGAIGEGELRDLAALRAELDRAGVKPNEKVNLNELCQRRVASLEKRLQAAEVAGDNTERQQSQQSLSEARRRLDWVQKLSLVHASPESVGFDMAA